MTRANFLTQPHYSYVFSSVLNYIDNIEGRRSLLQYVKSMIYTAESSRPIQGVPWPYHMEGKDL